MGKHLLWLADERYPDRKIIVWAGTAHLMRDPNFVDSGLPGPAMGKVVWEALGEDSYRIGMTSYEGKGNFIITDQHLLPEFEQLRMLRASNTDSSISGVQPGKETG